MFEDRLVINKECATGLRKSKREKNEYGLLLENFARFRDAFARHNSQILPTTLLAYSRVDGKIYSPLTDRFKLGKREYGIEIDDQRLNLMSPEQLDPEMIYDLDILVYAIVYDKHFPGEKRLPLASIVYTPRDPYHLQMFLPQNLSESKAAALKSGVDITTNYKGILYSAPKLIKNPGRLIQQSKEENANQDASFASIE